MAGNDDSADSFVVLLDELDVAASLADLYEARHTELADNFSIRQRLDGGNLYFYAL